MIKIVQANWCPKCRVMIDEWKVPGTLSNVKLRIGDPWPILEDTKENAHNKCKDCGNDYTGKINFRESNEMQFILNVAQELNNG